MNLAIRPVVLSDASALAEIYNVYVRDTVITFEETPVSSDDMADRIQKRANDGLPWLVVEQDKTILGYAYAAPWRERSAYRFSVEVSVYLDANQKQKGLGSALYQALFDTLEKTEVHAALAGIALPNDASIGLHEKFGMKQVAHLPEVGFKFDRWVDVAYWQKVLR